MVPVVFLLLSTPADMPALTGPEIVERMVRADNERRAALAGYAGVRHYFLENKRFDKRAEMTVRVTCLSNGTKNFDIIQESGPGYIRNRVLRKMMEAERDASQAGERDNSRFIPANYDFKLIKSEMVDERANYVLEALPKTDNKYLVRGRIWVDAEDFAVTRVDGTPAKNPSFWIHHVQIQQRYQRVGRFWLPAMNRSHAEVRVFGPTDVEIKYFDYVPNERELAAQKDAPEVRRRE